MAQKLNPKSAFRRSLKETAALQRTRPPVNLTRSAADSAQGIAASARRLTGEDLGGKNKSTLAGAGTVQPWQVEAWELLDLVGEQYFLMNILANRASQAALYVGKTDELADPGTSPVPVEDLDLLRILSSLGDGGAGLRQILYRAVANLFVAGEFWLVGISPQLLPGNPAYVSEEERRNRPLQQVDRGADVEGSNLTEDALQKFVWRVFSNEEINVDSGDAINLSLEDGTKIRDQGGQNLFPIRIWRPHPNRGWEATSATRSSLPVLRELVGLTMHTSAQIDSRLAGAGILMMPTEASAALKRAAGLPENSPQDPLLDALMEAMLTPIGDRESASALVPLVVSVPADTVDKVKHISFSTPLDKEAPKHRDEAIRRLALGQDAPPEILLGVGGMNHWGAWLVQEDVVKSHLEPPLALICSALTDQYLRPILEARGMSEEEIALHQIWYSVEHLIEKPSLAEDARALYAVDAISAEALRAKNGFSEKDAPEETTAEKTDQAVQAALQMSTAAPSLAQAPGLPALVEQLRAVLGGEETTRTYLEEQAAAQADAEEAPAEVIEVEEEGGETRGAPSTSPSDAPEGTPAAGGSA